MDSIKVNHCDGITVVTLNRPDRLNALDPGLVDAVVGIVQSESEKMETSAIVLTGAGRGFCAGVDFLATPKAERNRPRPPATRYANQQRFAQMVRTIRRARVPVIAAVNGPAAGSGMALALACDIRVAAPTAAFHPAALKIGLSAGECGLSYLLPRLIGASRAFEILLTARPVFAEEAIRIGLACETDPGTTALESAIAMGREVAAHDAFAVQLSKEVLWANLDSSFEGALEMENRTQILAGSTESAIQSRAAFLDRRKHSGDGE